MKTNKFDIDYYNKNFVSIVQKLGAEISKHSMEREEIVKGHIDYIKREIDELEKQLNIK